MVIFQAGLIDGNFEGKFEQHGNICPLAKSLSESDIAKVSNGGSNSRNVRYYMLELKKNYHEYIHQ